MRRLFDRLLSMLVLVLVLGSLIVIGGSAVGKPWLAAVVPTQSMEPSLYPGDLISVVPTWVWGGPSVGDIIVYKPESESIWIVHRIISGNQWDGYITKGDANPEPDFGRVTPGQITGVVPTWNGGALRIPHVGLLNLGQASPNISILIAIIGAGTVAVLGGQTAPGTRFRSRRRQAEQTAGMLFTVYASLIAVTLAAIILPTVLLSRGAVAEYRAVATIQENVSAQGMFTAGETYTDSQVIENAGWLPLILVMTSNDARVQPSPSTSFLPPRSSVEVSLQVTSAEPGAITSLVRQSFYMPLLPPQLLQLLDRIHPFAAAAVGSLIPTLIVTWVCLTDRRIRTKLRERRLMSIAQGAR